MKNAWLAFPLLMLANPVSAEPAAPVGPALQAAIDRVAAEEPALAGVELTVWSPRLHIDWSGASGYTTTARTQRLAPDQPFRIASVTKSFVSAVILRLAEQDKLAIADPIEKYISPETAAKLREGGYDPQAIQVQHLMNHRSGLVDHTESPVFTQRLSTDGRYHWTRSEQIALAMTLKGPLNPPGVAYHYSDTGYVILGEIVERVSGQPLAQALREQLNYRKYGLSTTWLETLEPEPAGHKPRAHQYEPNGEVDTTDHDPSFDLYGGGGLVSTTHDLARFFRALLRGEVFAQPQTLTAGLAAPGSKAGDAPAPAYAPLMSTVQVGRHMCWGKGGYWGTVAIYCPDIDAAIAVSVNRGRSPVTGKVAAEVAKVLDAALPQAPRPAMGGH